MLILNGVLPERGRGDAPGHRPRAHPRPRPLRDASSLIGGVPVFFDEHVARLVRRHRGARAPEAHRQARAGRADLPPQRGQWRGRRRLPPARHCRPPRRRAQPAGADRPARLPEPAAARDQLPRRPSPRPVQGHDGDAVVPAQRAAEAAGVDDAILVDDEGRIFEGATSNVFLVRGGGLVTRRPKATSSRACCAPRSRSSRLPRHPRGRGVGARRRPAPGRRHAAHEQRARHRAGRRVDGIDCCARRAVGGVGALIGAAEAASVAAFRARYL